MTNAVWMCYTLFREENMESFSNIDFKNLKTKPCSYKQLIDFFKDEAKLASDIESIKDVEIRKEYMSEALEYYAKKYDCDTKDVFFGDINFRKEFWNGDIRFPYVVVVGSLRAKDCYITATNLKVVLGDLDLTRTTANISSLEYAKKLIATGANIKYICKDVRVDELVCNENCACENVKDCFKKQLQNKKEEKERGKSI